MKLVFVFLLLIFHVYSETCTLDGDSVDIAVSTDGECLISSSNFSYSQYNLLSDWITTSSDCSCECDFCLSNSDFISGHGITISRKGVYCLTEDINVQLSNGDSAITIANSNVVINLKGKFIRQGITPTSNNIGILLKTGINNIIIKDGSILRFPGVGSYVEPGVNTVTCSNLLIKKCAYNGIFGNPGPFSNIV